ncbi:MarR family winged helix-turn-helix transcriptional regulator [Mucilaginibacter sp. KACC 22063]|uniref:MarR family winged helix-turn-helix transcriptional regulator n=1 Tax=Mucilaginibacter sp. KACC 22063 TaxID=3025666 RepID=UPI0023654388|nr:MarR family transcriptional regulator [Mucilaginibacter sp. KACC 22063]WDF56994.1 MarR family transcriptional regulator [Mucilaginibacter sp. KACC 22063]
MKIHDLASALRLEVSKLHKTLRVHTKLSEGLSLSEITALSLLYFNGTVYPSELAEVLRIKAQSVSQVVALLDEKGLIVRTPSDIDKRKIALTLSMKGKHLVEESRRQRDSWLTEAMNATLNKQELELLEKAVKVLEKLSDY